MTSPSACPLPKAELCPHIMCTDLHYAVLPMLALLPECRQWREDAPSWGCLLAPALALALANSARLQSAAGLLAAALLLLGG